MTPIDDELRAALQGRASALAPSPDPLAGIERRAQRIRRTRLGAAVAASALAVSAIAVAVPALQGTRSSGPDVPRLATAPASPTPAAASPYVLDPDAPWTYRGDRALAVQGDVDAYTVEWSARHRVLTDDVDLVPLFGQLYEPSATPEVVYLVHDRTNGERWWGVAQATESGPEILVDERLPAKVLALAAALPGDEVARLLVVAAPGTTLGYGADGAGEIAPMTELASGVGITALEGDPTSDVFRVAGDGGEVFRAPAPDVPVTAQPTGGPETALDPENPWEVRGDPTLVTAGQLEALGEDWATRNGIDAPVEIRALYVQRYEADAGVEVVYIVRSGDGPWTWGVASLGEGGWWWYAENEITEPLTALAAALPDAGDQGAERLLVVAAPSTGGGVYAENGKDFSPMLDLAAGVFGTSLSPGDPDDAYMVLDGNGDLDNPVFRGPVPDFQNAG